MSKTIIIAGVDGYIGNALAQRMLARGHKVIGIDSFYRREWVEGQMGSFSAIPIKSMEEKEALFKGLGDFTFVEADICRFNSLRGIFGMLKPDVVFNLAHYPSAALSHISQSWAEVVLKNNILGTNAMLWAVKEACPEAHYITIGTTGEYDHYSNIDIEEGYFQIEHNGRKSEQLIYPRRPGSIYHASKTSSTYLIDLLARIWDLKCTDIQQSIVYGAYTEEIDETGVYSRLDSDEAGGTVLNRFAVQAALGKPLTVYGKGDHQRGFIALNDSIQALEIAVNSPADKGKVQTWNQLSEWHSMNDVASIIWAVMKNTFKEDIEISHIDTPRSENTGSHYYKYITKNLTDMGYVPTRSMIDEVTYMIEALKHCNLRGLENNIQPEIQWGGPNHGCK